MYKAMTDDIEVTVQPRFMADRSDPRAGRYFWAYTVEIANRGPRTVQLVARHWRITDASGKLEEVRGAGVVGEQPILRGGDSYKYTSGCPLTTPSGIMAGAYRMVDEGGKSFEVEIPAFSLDTPDIRRSLN
jgi:ApaG protein